MKPYIWDPWIQGLPVFSVPYINGIKYPGLLKMEQIWGTNFNGHKFLDGSEGQSLSLFGETGNKTIQRYN